MALARDGCVVDTHPLAGALRRFVDDWNRTRPPTGGRFAPERTRGVSPMSAIDWLAQETGIHREVISNVVYARQPTVGLTNADRLATAIGRTDLFYDGDPPSLTIRPNPTASARARAECCGGSSSALTGTIDPLGLGHQLR